MPQDAFTLRHVAAELEKKLLGGKISKINMPERDELSLIIYTRSGSVKLEISSSAKNNRISLSSSEKPNPQNAPNFCMLLRKHLQNAQITAIRQIAFERIIAIDFDCFSEFSTTKMTLYCEIMGKYSNMILVEKGVILGALKQTTLEENARRVLFSGAKYTLPPPQGKTDPTKLEELKKAMAGRRYDERQICADIEGIAYSTAAEICASSGGDASAEEIYDYVTSDNIAPCVTFDEHGKPNDFKVRTVQQNAARHDDILSAQREYYDYVYIKKTFDDMSRRLSAAVRTAVKKAEKRLAQIQEKLFECESADEIKLKGELITANIYRLERGMTSFEADDYYSEQPKKIKISLDRQLTPAQNAQKYYKKYAKMKRTVEYLTVQLSDEQGRLNYLTSIESSIATAECTDDLRDVESELTAEGLIKKAPERKKKTPEVTPMRQYEIEGFRVTAGRNNVQNDRLLKSLAPEDIWLHVNRFHSAHVGIAADGKDVPDEVIAKAAAICAYYSQARGRDKVTVDYTRRKYVKKPPKANLGFVIYTDYSNIIVTPDPHRECAKN